MVIIARWRLFRHVFTADIVKMFRQVSVHPDDTDWQRVVWRSSPEQRISDYKLLTVTYGTTCAPYLANRVLLQLAMDKGQRFPLGANVLRRHIYVDDAFAGAHSLDDALQVQKQLCAILATAGMSLDKWAANNPNLLTEHSMSSPSVYFFEPEDTVSTLGLRWSPVADVFSYSVQPPSATTLVTKRTSLPEISRLYDPLGWLSPIIVRAKLLLQQLWITGKDWDTPVDLATRTSWLEYREELPELQGLNIPRWMGTSSGSMLQLHGFSDASEKAYAAAVYAVVIAENTIHTTLLAAKSKVAPIKVVSLPRLELCSAALLSRLLVRLIKDLELDDAEVHCWSDSQVVLAWLRGHPSNWKSFVANRVSEILTLLPNIPWRHVRSKDNLADLATQGASPQQLIDSSLWWHGPSWLFDSQAQFEDTQNYVTAIDQRKQINTFLIQSDENLFSKFSSWTKMLRVISYCFRWRSNIALPVASRPPAELRASELRRAQTSIIKAVQAETYSSEINRLCEGKNFLRNSTLCSLKPFLDDDGILRVGGRLQHSYLPYNEKHPAILPGKHHVSKLLIKFAHIVTLHGGPQLTQSYLQRAFWVTYARTVIKNIIHQCVRCTRFQGRTLQQQMAPLPPARITPTWPFNVTGLDYAGPFPVRTSKGRGQKSTKGYVAVFVCMVTRAVHLEVVSDLSTLTFLAAFARFTARRGLCHTVYSDNGTTFRGADQELRRLFDSSSRFSAELAAAAANDGVHWSFTPPRAPHFGGLWEAAVKSFKHHLKRVLGVAALTFEEITTLASTIEACLNSRPLSAFSSDPLDIAALTPGHFLIGTALRSPPEPPSDVQQHSLSRWQTLSDMRNHFWRRWRKEVIQQVQHRSKWLIATSTIQKDDLVLMTDDQQPPLHWPLARVIDVHAGLDGLVRVVTLLTATPTLTRPIHRLILLPINDLADASLSAQTDLMAGGTTAGCN